MKLFKTISLIAIIMGCINTPSIAQSISPKHSADERLNKPSTEDISTPNNKSSNADEKANSNDSANAIDGGKPILQFSQTSVKDIAKITQLTIMDKSQLSVAGVKEESIYHFVHQFSEHANNIFYSNSMAGGRVIYGVIIKPSPENALTYAKQNGIEPTQTNLDKICKEEPTQCSVTSISNFQNGLISQMVLNQFDKDMYDNNIEIFWNNYKSPGEIKFFFEISLKNTI